MILTRTKRKYARQCERLQRLLKISRHTISNLTAQVRNFQKSYENLDASISWHSICVDYAADYHSDDNET